MYGMCDWFIYCYSLKSVFKLSFFERMSSISDLVDRG